MKPVNPYFEASDTAEYTLLDESICRVRCGTVRAVEQGAVVYAVAPGAIAIAAEVGSRAVATQPGALAVAIVAGSHAAASARRAYAQSFAHGALAEAFIAGAVAHAPFGKGVGHASGAYVLSAGLKILDHYSAMCEGVIVARIEELRLNPIPDLPPVPYRPSKIADGVGDLGYIILHDFYRYGPESETPDYGYPWETNYRDLAEIAGFSIAMDGKDIRASGIYTGPGMHLRDAIRHAEILGDNVPAGAYDKLKSLTIEAVLDSARGRRPSASAEASTSLSF